MPIALGPTTYGKSGVRLVKVRRDSERHELIDLDVAVALAGNFAAAHLDGDNTALLATDTMRNTVYAFAKTHPLDSIEAFGLALAEHFVTRGPTVSGATIDIASFPWRRIAVAGVEHPHSFVRESGERTAMVSFDQSGRRVTAGLRDMLLLKTTQSGWEQFYRDDLTTLPDTDDRILATSVTARWDYAPAELDALDYNAAWQDAYETILSTFTDHYSPSMQFTLHQIGRAVLERVPQIERIFLSFPNKHHLRYDLARFGLANNNEIFQATSEPYGLIEGWVVRQKD